MKEADIIKCEIPSLFRSLFSPSSSRSVGASHYAIITSIKTNKGVISAIIYHVQKDETKIPKCQVKKDKIYDIMNQSEYTVDNLESDAEKYGIIAFSQKWNLHLNWKKRAESILNKEIEYSIFNKNCEDVVTWIKYGVPFSHQVALIQFITTSIILRHL